MNENVDGFYAGYFSAAAGNSIALLVLQGGKIVGTDGSANYDGDYHLDENDSGLRGNVKVTVKKNTNTIQGEDSGPDGMNYMIELDLPKDFYSKKYVTIKTTLGLVNARFEKIRNLGAAI